MNKESVAIRTEARRLADAATPEPWRAVEDAGTGLEMRFDAAGDLVIAFGDGWEGDAEFAAAARTLVPKLSDELDTMDEVLMNLLESLSKTMHKLDETADGLGKWDDSTEYIEWARDMIQKGYAEAIKAGARRRCDRDV